MRRAKPAQAATSGLRGASPIRHGFRAIMPHAMQADDDGAKSMRAGRARAIALGGIGIVCFIAALALIWYAASALFLIFAGILFGFFLTALSRLIAFTRLAYALRLTVVCIFVALVLSGAVALGGQTIAREASLLATTLRTQVTNIRAWLDARGIDSTLLDLGTANHGQNGANVAGEDSGAARTTPPAQASLPSGAGAVLGQTVQIVLRAIAGVGNFFIIIFLGIAIAAQPGVYHDGLVRMIPPRHRARGRAFLDDVGETLNRWLLGQLLTMCAIFVVVWIGLLLLGIPGAFILGFQAGLLAFIPTVGAIVSGAIILLASLSSGWVGVIGAAVLYLGVQTLESYVLTPIIQRQAINIPPATIFGAQILLGVLFGIWGLALALPLIVIIRVALIHFYLAPPEPAASA